MQWDNFNEATTLQASAETYKERFGFYPAAILATKFTDTARIWRIANLVESG
ncbi:hypothetical protein D3C74_495200 [compost metagenome]